MYMYVNIYKLKQISFIQLTTNSPAASYFTSVTFTSKLFRSTGQEKKSTENLARGR